MGDGCWRCACTTPARRQNILNFITLNRGFILLHSSPPGLTLSLNIGFKALPCLKYKENSFVILYLLNFLKYIALLFPSKATAVVTVVSTKSNPTALIHSGKEGKGILHSENSICGLILQNLKHMAGFQSHLSACLNTSGFHR